MFAKLDRKPSTALQNNYGPDHKTPTNNGDINQQCINNNNRTTALEWAAANVTEGGGA